MGLFIHLGAHKTATTHLANCLEKAESDLLADGVAFLGPENLRQAPLNLRLLLNNPEGRPDQQKAAMGILRGLMEEHRDLIISEELILGGFTKGQFLGAGGQVYPQAGQRLRHLLDLVGTRDVTLLLAIRSPADFLTSAFGEGLRHEGPLKIDTFLNGFQPALLRWSELIGRLQRDSEAQRLICWRYEDLANIRGDLLIRMLGPKLAAAVPDLPPTRLGLSDSAYRMLLDRSVGDAAVRDLTGEVRKAHPKQTPRDTLRVLPQELHDECDRNYAEDCASIAAMPWVHFLKPAAVQG